MKKHIYLLIAIAVLFSTTACNEILDQMPNNSISGSSMWTTESQVDQGIIGVYYSLQRPINGSTLIGAGNDIGYYGFETYGMTGQGAYGINSLFASSVNAGNTRFTFAWKWFYDGIHRANTAIAYIPNVPMDDKKKARLVAECKTLRAFFYSRLNTIYGNGGLGVPLYLEPIQPEDCTLGQSPEAEVWAQVIQDLTDAINEPNLPNNQIQGEGRMSKGAAYAIRGKAYLSTKEYQKAADDFQKVGECGYALYPNFKQLFKEANERCEEMILSVQYIADPTGYGTALQKFCAPFQCGAKDAAGCWTDVRIAPAVVHKFEVVVDNATVKDFKWSDFIPEWDGFTVDERKVFFLRNINFEGTEIHPTVTAKVNTELDKLSERARALYLPDGNEERISKAYANRDPRLGLSVIVPYSHMLGVNIHPPTGEAEYITRWPVTGKHYANQPNAENNLREGMLPSLTANDVNTMYYMFRKFVGEGLEFARREHNPIDEPIIRYADVLLNWAEALVELDKLPEAMAKVKQVRDRAGVPTVASSFASKDVARNYVRDERRREFVCEGVNFFDEMRWRTLKETKFDNLYPQNVWGGKAGGTNYEWIGDAFYTWPVPRAEIEKNPNLKKTPGWEDRY
ncbi:RagB/SusD family nutrient uptake outer membrane protein [Bacteroides sp. OttesenSCG-928-D19]|nr:RagB/SusD family nutrient uptake outer membrane protein [Bacteroides sp. OttesenSCG-928-D19]